MILFTRFRWFIILLRLGFWKMRYPEKVRFLGRFYVLRDCRRLERFYPNWLCIVWGRSGLKKYPAFTFIRTIQVSFVSHGQDVFAREIILRVGFRIRRVCNLNILLLCTISYLSVSKQYTVLIQGYPLYIFFYKIKDTRKLIC